jgi:hypothetical protein
MRAIVGEVFGRFGSHRFWFEIEKQIKIGFNARLPKTWDGMTLSLAEES